MCQIGICLETLHTVRKTTGLKTIDKTSLFEDMPIKNRTTFDTSKSEHDHIGD